MLIQSQSGLCETQPPGGGPKPVWATRRRGRYGQGPLVRGGHGFQEVQANTLPKADEFPGNVPFSRDRLGC